MRRAGNQHQFKQQCEKFIKTLPPCDFSMVYGSQAFHQKGAKRSETKQIDLVLATPDAQAWHTENLRTNRNHYSFLKYLGPNVISKVQDFGPGMYYHPYIEFEGKMWKYGLISTRTLISDLKNWDHLFASARLLNPHLILSETAEIKIARKLNNEAALRIALLLLKDQEFDIDRLYSTICQLGFEGDVRWLVENPNKVYNIIVENQTFYDETYRPFLPDYTTDADGGNYKRQARLADEKLLLMLPGAFLDRNKKNSRRRVSMQDSLKRTLHQIVRKNSAIQTVKGLFSAGPLKSILYVQDKLKKRRRQIKTPADVL